MLPRFSDQLQKGAAVGIVAGAFLASVLIAPRPLAAAQDPAKPEVKKEAPAVPQKVVEKAAEVAVPPPPPAPFIQVLPMRVVLPQPEAVAPVKGAKAVVPDKAEVKAAPKAAVKAAVAAPAGLMMPGVPGANNVEAMAQQLYQQYVPILKAELRFLTQAATPTPAQRREISMAGGKALKEAATKTAEFQLGINRVVLRADSYPDPRKMIRDAMESTAKAKFEPEQFGRYQKELERRTKDYREATMLNLVANLDKLLILSEEQREKLSVSLLAGWDDRTYPTLENLVTYEAYYPTIPDQALNGILTEEQRKIWRGAQKINFGSIRNFVFMNNNGIMPDEDDEDIKAAMAEEAKK